MNENDPLPPTEMQMGTVESFGWLRRPELDTPVSDVWETPTGQIWAVAKGAKPLSCRVKPGWIKSVLGRRQ